MSWAMCPAALPFLRIAERPLPSCHGVFSYVSPSDGVDILASNHKGNHMVVVDRLS